MWWKIEPDDPPLFPLPQTSSWQLVNPILYSQFPPSEKSTGPLEIRPGTWITASREIIIAISDDEIVLAPDSQFNPDSVIELIAGLLWRLRHLSGQATLPRSETFESVWPLGLDHIPAFVPPLAPGRGAIQSFMFHTAITSEHIYLAANHGDVFDPPTHEGLFLDAIEAYREYDYRKTILFAAMSTEVAFGFKIDNTYKKILAEHADERFRVIKRHLGGANKVYKDPIYEKLRARADFKTLINELALYVLCRSLISEKEDLYHRALRVYSTRNQLAHAGVLDENKADKAYSLDKKGAMSVLKTAIELFSWLGERADFSLPTFGFVSSKD